MTGLDAADRMCYEQAKAMGLPPNYRAFISSHRQDLVHVVYPGFRETLPITNLRVGWRCPVAAYGKLFPTQ